MGPELPRIVVNAKAYAQVTGGPGALALAKACAKVAAGGASIALAPPLAELASTYRSTHEDADRDHETGGADWVRTPLDERAVILNMD